MKKNKVILALCATILAVLLFIYLQKDKEQASTEIASSIPASVAVTEAPKKPSSAQFGFSAAARDEIEKCLGTPAGNFSELEALVSASAGEVKSDQLEWKVVQFEDEAGQTFRVKLAREFTESGKPHLTLTMFSVDAEGLPDRIKLPPSEAMNPDLAALERVLRNKRITSEIESHRYFYPDEKELITEREDRSLKKLHYAGGKIRLACEAVAGEPSCHCVQ